MQGQWKTKRPYVFIIDIIIIIIIAKSLFKLAGYTYPWPRPKFPSWIARLICF